MLQRKDAIGLKLPERSPLSGADQLAKAGAMVEKRAVDKDQIGCIAGQDVPDQPVMLAKRIKVIEARVGFELGLELACDLADTRLGQLVNQIDLEQLHPLEHQLGHATRGRGRQGGRDAQRPPRDQAAIHLGRLLRQGVDAYPLAHSPGKLQLDHVVVGSIPHGGLCTHPTSRR